jgi:hypothetical protein
MGSFYRKPEEVRLELGEGQWLLVKKYLTFGEERHAQALVIKPGTFKQGQNPELDLEHLEIAQAASYLLDWSITDADDKPIRITGASYEFVAASLNNMAPEGTRRILDAIQAHHSAMTAERELEKKGQAGATASAPTSTSVA